VGHRKKVFDHAEGMIRQGDRAQANYRKSETLPGLVPDIREIRFDCGYLPVQPCRQGGDRSDRPEHSAYSLLPFYSHHSRSIHFFAGVSLVSVAQWETSIFLISYPDRSRSRKIAWYTPFSQSSRWYR
jgi:hypothetical protein